jgi:hypothetical protein
MNEPKLNLREALELVLDQVDYTRGACAPTEMVAAVLPVNVLTIAHDALTRDAQERSTSGGN